jgi:hypothetical protein
MSGAWARGSTRAHRRLRTLVLERDGTACRAHADGWCAKPRVRPHECAGRVQTHTPGRPDSYEAHHTRGKAATGDDYRHVVVACRSCNQAIGEPTEPDPRPQPRTNWRNR